MKRILILLLAATLILSLFSVTALAKKPESKPAEPEVTEDADDNDDGDTQDAKEKKPNEKRDAKAAFREAMQPLLTEVRANREEWGLIGDGMEGLDEGIEAQLELIRAQAIELDEATLAMIAEKCAQFKELNAQVRGIKREIQTLWKAYINAKKISDVEAGTAALNQLIEKQELRIGVRTQIVAILTEIGDALGVAIDPPAEPEVPEELAE